jgi:perosamine synthetase
MDSVAKMIPYSHQSINEADIAAVTEVLRSDYLTTGPKIQEFEEKFADKVGAKYAVAVSSGTAALHAAMFAIGIKPGDEVIVPAITFIATANAVVYQGGTPVFADVNPDTLLIDWQDVDHKSNEKTKTIIPVDYAGQISEIDCLWNIAHEQIIVDACHSLIHEADVLTCHSFHPVKNMTTGEGGMVTTDSQMVANIVKAFRDHGRANGEMVNLGYNYRMTDIQAALGISQLDRLDQFVSRRQEIAKIYDEAFKGTKIRPLEKVSGHTYHLYVVKVPNRDLFREKLAEKGIGTQVHYRPVNLEDYYNQPGVCPVAEKVWKEIVSLPCYPDLTDTQVEQVIEAAKGAVK